MKQHRSTEQIIGELLAGPKYPDREFTRCGTSFPQVYALAADLLDMFAQTDTQNKPICLATHDKAVIAAALLASLAGGPSLLLPYALSAASLARMQEVTDFNLALADTARELPAGVEVLRPQASPQGEGKEARPLISGHAVVNPGAELLKIFTGGSTGAPKVWSKTGENIFGESLFHTEQYAVSEQDCIMATVPPWHIYGLLFSVVLPLVSSATVLNETPSFPNEILATAAAQKVTVLASVPAHYRVLREKGLNLRLAFSSAGMLEAADNAAFCLHNPSGVIEVYGSTETGGIATRNRSQGEELFTPFSPIDWKIVHDRLAVRSPYISPDLPVDDQGFFLANDRAEATSTEGFPEGFLLKGRSDAVVKVGGKRVDLEEIAALIKKEPGVIDCLVTAQPESGGRGQRIAALIQGETVDKEQVKKSLEASLEPYALPRLIKTVPALPVKQNGKYDRSAITRLLNNE
ncbi:AMP-binding protein [Desulfobulbus sp. US4]|nr:AMP-binding protein [Desulfobulbus sp. US4]